MPLAFLPDANSNNQLDDNNTMVLLPRRPQHAKSLQCHFTMMEDAAELMLCVDVWLRISVVESEKGQ